MLSNASLSSDADHRRTIPIVVPSSSSPSVSSSLSSSGDRRTSNVSSLDIQTPLLSSRPSSSSLSSSAALVSDVPFVGPDVDADGNNDAAPIIPLNIAGSGAHEHCSQTCILSHPKRSAVIYLMAMYGLTLLATVLLMIVQAIRGDDHTTPSTSTSTTTTYSDNNTEALMIRDNTGGTMIIATPNESTNITIPMNITGIILNATNTIILPSISNFIDSAEESLQSLSSLSSITPKVPDDSDMVSAMLMLLWGLSPLASAVITISWTYYRFRHTLPPEPISIPVSSSSSSSSAIHPLDSPATDRRTTSRPDDDTHLHHHHPMFVNPIPPSKEDELPRDLNTSIFTLFPAAAPQSMTTTPSASSSSQLQPIDTIIVTPNTPILSSPVADGLSSPSASSTTIQLPSGSPLNRSTTDVTRPTTSIGAPLNQLRTSTATSTAVHQQLPSNIRPSGQVSISPSSSLSSSTILIPPSSTSITRSHSAPIPLAYQKKPAAMTGAVPPTPSRQRCPRVHRVAPFYSRRSIRPWYFFPVTKEQWTVVYPAIIRFLTRSYFLPIFIPTIAAISQYTIAGLFECIGWLSTAFVSALVSALGLADSTGTEVVSVMLAFLYETILGVWWDPFPPGSADWGKGMNFHGASWIALSAMEEMGWAGILFPCLYELYPKNPTKASIITGLIWSSWHWPFILLGPANWIPASAVYHPGLLSTPVVYGFITFTLSTTASRVIMVRLLFYSDDLWSQCVYHAAHNVMIFNFFAQLPNTDTSQYPAASYFIAEAGIPVNIIYIILATLTIRKWNKQEKQQEEEQRQRFIEAAHHNDNNSEQTHDRNTNDHRPVDTVRYSLLHTNGISSSIANTSNKDNTRRNMSPIEEKEEYNNEDVNHNNNIDYRNQTHNNTDNNHSRISA